MVDLCVFKTVVVGTVVASAVVGTEFVIVGVVPVVVTVVNDVVVVSVETEGQSVLATVLVR